MLSTYLGTLRRHDLWLEQIVEPLPAPDWDQAHDADRKPIYLAARSVKVIERYPGPAARPIGSSRRARTGAAGRRARSARSPRRSGSESWATAHALWR
jgi:hypothetical protein